MGLNRSSLHFKNSVHLLQPIAALKWGYNCLEPFRHENLAFSPFNDWNEGVSLFLTPLIFTWYLLTTIHSLHYILYTGFSLTPSLRNSTFQLGHKYDIHPVLNYMWKLLLLKTITEVQFLLWVNSPHFTLHTTPVFRDLASCTGLHLIVALSQDLASHNWLKWYISS